jgi:hypothetical protein
MTHSGVPANEFPEPKRILKQLSGNTPWQSRTPKSALQICGLSKVVIFGAPPHRRAYNQRNGMSGCL